MAASQSPASPPSRRTSDPLTPTPLVPVTKSMQRACSNCARLKMKCQWPVSGNARSGASCTRCTRMGLSCSIPEPVKRKKRNKSTRVAQLEKKIDGIVSLLSSRSYPQEQRPTNTLPLTPSGSDQNQCPSQPHAVAHSSASQDYGCGPTSVPPDMTLDLASFELFPGFRLSREEADHWLNVYREDLMPNFPYIIIQAHADAFLFHNESRVLFWTVMAAAVPFTAHIMSRFKEWFKSYIAQHVVVQEEKTLEILQAIMLYLSWGDAGFYAGTHVTTLVQIAMSIFLELKLQFPPAAQYPNPSTLLGDAFVVLQRGSPKDRNSLHTMAEKRVLLGWWTMTSISSSLFGRYSALPWTAYMTACCESLSQQDEYATDALIVASAKMQRLAQDRFRAVPRIDPADAVPVYTASVEMALAGATRDMEEFWKTQPDYVKKNHILATHYHAILLRIYEPIISMRPPDHTDPRVPEPHPRTEALWACLTAARNLFDLVLAFLPEQLTTLPIHSHAPMAFAIVTSSCLLLMDHSPDWQPSIARRSFSYADITKRLGEKFEAADRVATEAGKKTRSVDTSDCAFAQYGTKMRWISQWYLSRVQEKGPLHPFGMLNPRSASAEPVANPGVSDDDDYGVVPGMSDVAFEESFWQVLSGNMAPDLMQVFPTPVADMQESR